MLIPVSIRRFAKKPEEVSPIRVRYQDRLPMGANLDTATVEVFDLLQNNLTNTMLVPGSVAIEETSQRVYFAIQGGTEGLRANIKITVTLDDSVKNGGVPTTFVDYISMQIRTTNS